MSGFDEHVTIQEINLLDVAFPETVNHFKNQGVEGEVSYAHFFGGVSHKKLVAGTCYLMWLNAECILLHLIILKIPPKQVPI